MLPSPTKSVALLATIWLVLAGLAGVVGAAPAGTASAPAQGPVPQSAQPTQESTCAETPPDDFADPSSDVIGWEDGIWYAEPIAVDQSDGLNGSEQDALVARTTARVEYVRCVEFDADVPVSVIDRETYRERDSGRSIPPALRTFDNAKFEALFMIGEETDSIAVQQANRGSAVLGFYSPTSDEIVVIAEDPSALRIDELTLAHELIHAWQDETFDLTSDAFQPRLRDQANARSGLIEGDARYVELLYRQECEGGAWNGTCLSPPDEGGGGGELANFGVYLTVFQPYSDGPAFVRSVRTHGGWEAVDALYASPPESAEQVIHVERYGVDEPTDPAFEDRASDDWERVTPPNRPDYARVGESALMSTFVYPYYHSEGTEQLLPRSEWLNFDEDGEIETFDPLDYESNYTEGWDGDRLHVYRNGENETAYVWRLAWDSPQDAAEFVTGYEKLLRYWGARELDDGLFLIPSGGFADAFRVEVDGSTVTIVNAPTVAQLDDVRPPATGGSVDEAAERPRRPGGRR